MSCQLEECSKPVHPGSEYCSRAHRDLAWCLKHGNDEDPMDQTCRFPDCTKEVYPGSFYCSRSHRDAAPHHHDTSLAQVPKLCQFPGCESPVFSGSSYCSKRHRDAIQASLDPMLPDTTFEATCNYPDCSKPVYPGSLYCSLRHRDSQFMPLVDQDASTDDIPSEVGSIRVAPKSHDD